MSHLPFSEIARRVSIFRQPQARCWLEALQQDPDAIARINEHLSSATMTGKVEDVIFWSFVFYAFCSSPYVWEILPE